MILYLSTKDPETRNLKICVRSKKFEEDFFNETQTDSDSERFEELRIRRRLPGPRRALAL